MTNVFSLNDYKTVKNFDHIRYIFVQCFITVCCETIIDHVQETSTRHTGSWKDKENTTKGRGKPSEKLFCTNPEKAVLDVDYRGVGPLF